jgi:hypothetical protein
MILIDVREGRLSPGPRALTEIVDAAIAMLTPKRRRLLLVRFGADGAPPVAAGRAAERLGLGTRQNVQQHEQRALTQLADAAGVELTETIRRVEGKAAASRKPIEDVLGRELTVASRTPKYAKTFYLRLLTRLAPTLGAS